MTIILAFGTFDVAGWYEKEHLRTAADCWACRDPLRTLSLILVRVG